jgi:hypothetical protein
LNFIIKLTNLIARDDPKRSTNAKGSMKDGKKKADQKSEEKIGNITNKKLLHYINTSIFTII